MVWIWLAGCGPGAGEPLALTWRAESFSETHGLRISYDGRLGHAGIRDTTCEVDTMAGGGGPEHDVPGPDDVVVDGWTDPDWGFTTVTRGTFGAWVASPLEDDPEVFDLDWPGVDHTLLVSGGLVAISEDGDNCVAEWHDFDGGVQDRVVVPPRICHRSTEITADRAEAELYAATPSQVLRLTRSGWEETGIEADHIIWDPAAEVLYTAVHDEPRVTAWERDGHKRWSTRIDDGIVALSDLGDRGAAVIVAKTEDGPGLLWILDGDTGRVRLDTTTPAPAKGLVPSGNGQVLGLVRLTGVLWLEIVDADELL